MAKLPIARIRAEIAERAIFLIGVAVSAFVIVLLLLGLCSLGCQAGWFRSDKVYGEASVVEGVAHQECLIDCVRVVF